MSIFLTCAVTHPASQGDSKNRKEKIAKGADGAAAPFFAITESINASIKARERVHKTPNRMKSISSIRRRPAHRRPPSAARRPRDFGCGALATAAAVSMRFQDVRDRERGRAAPVGGKSILGLRWRSREVDDAHADDARGERRGD